jgi:sugar O-acyltransferase (sialic acid O-acetyltransferase NeuD family)
MTKKAIVFGTGTLGELVQFYLDNDSDYQVVAFCETDPKSTEFCGVPIVSFHDVEKNYSPTEYDMFVAIGYRKMNELRKKFCEQGRAKGYKLLSYISSKATYWNTANKIGDNVFIFEDNTIQPFVEIGDGTILWSGNHIGHHSKIGNYCFITSHVVISGFCSLGEQTFVGVNATIIDNINIGEKVLIGAGSYISKRIHNEQVIVTDQSKILDVNSDRFLR